MFSTQKILSTGVIYECLYTMIYLYSFIMFIYVNHLYTSFAINYTYNFNKNKIILQACLNPDDEFTLRQKYDNNIFNLLK